MIIGRTPFYVLLAIITFSVVFAVVYAVISAVRRTIINEDNAIDFLSQKYGINKDELKMWLAEMEEHL